MDNFSIKKARGKFIVPADSDDEFIPSTFEKFINEKYLVPTSGSINPKIVKTLDSFDITWGRVPL